MRASRVCDQPTRSGDLSADRHAGWAADIKEAQGFAPNDPMIGDTDFNVSKLYGMLPAEVSGDTGELEQR